ncbi:MAG: phosphodiester glycosidase family protein [Oscillospiraceae bacterium]|nr:phosphodiester glycosidase family protein [Oscillospiraceae bacterium]
MKHSLFPLCYGTALVLFTAYLALDTFVLRTAYQTDATQMNTAMFDTTEAEQTPTQAGTQAAHRHRSGGEAQAGAGSQSGSDPSVTETDGAQITVTEYEAYDTRIYVADVLLPSVQALKTAFAEDTYGRNITANTSEIAAAHDAVFAVNGDYYGAQERGIVIRNGVIYRDTPGTNDVLCIYADGTMQVVSPDACTAQELVDSGVWQAFSFGPGLLANGEITVTQDQEVGKAMASNPRTAIGQIDANHFVFVVSDGRTEESAGLSLYELAQFMQELGVTTAYNLDGGGSSTMYYNEEVINNPTTGGRIKERGVSDIVYIG